MLYREGLLIMYNNKANYRPIKFLDRMEGNNHIVLLYDNEKYANLVIARYLLNGLQKGESCVFFTAEIRKRVEEILSAEGIDIDSYKRTNSLRIFPIESHDINNKLDALGTLRRIREEATRGMKPPFRFVGRTIRETGTIEGMNLGLVVERAGHEHFEEFDNSQLCYYDISRIEQSNKDEWIRKLLENHHHVIYASEPDKAVAFETMLLEPEE
jgi:MEDS: MEthanogen/methylotroph, DcmR Sensory domain